jgi:hypothetical protein
MPEIKNNFLKGRMNQDLDSRILPAGEYREAINLLISRSEGATVGEFENVLGNTNVGTVSSTKALSVIGNFIDKTNNKVYAFATDFSNDDPNSRATSSETCLILEFDLTNPGTPSTLVSGFFLNFNKKFPIYGVNLLEELLFWTDNFNQPRRINITTASNNASAYTLESQISVAKYYPYDPAIPMERSTAITSGSGNTSTQITVTVAQPNVRVGDVVTDNDKTDFQNLKIGNSTPLVKVIKVISTTVFEVSPAISTGALPGAFKIDFSRTSMENLSEQYLSNYSTQTVGTVMAAGSGLSGTNLYTYATYPTTGATPGTYAGEPGVDAGFTTDSTLGTGTGDITVVVNGLGGVSSIVAASLGTGWVIGDTITVSSSVIGGGTDVVITLTAASIDTATIIRIDSDALLGGVPRVGDIVTNLTSANNVPHPSNPIAAAQFNLRISTITINNVSNTDSGRWTITFDNDATVGGVITGFTANDSIAIATNPLYDSTFPGDTKFLDDRFVRFSYRFKFNDNEYSLMAPFSQIMFIPKQYGEFGLGQIDIKTPPDNASGDAGINNYYQDETDAYTSTILQWFENDIDSIGLKLPLPASVANIQSLLNIKEIDILYKESDALAVKVLDTINVSEIATAQTYTIQYDDDLHGLLNQLYYSYTYKSNKPYKTLPEDQTIRVYDKVPIKALGQEIISNRIVYGNFVERMTPPDAIPYSVGYSNRDAQSSDYVTQYPYHNIKQNRTYQVGIVLADYYGRQSDVILSSYDNVDDVLGSSVYIPYRVSGDATTAPIISWLGKNLTLSIDEAIGDQENTSLGQPGIYREQGFVLSITVDVAGSGFEANTTYSVDGGGGCTIRATSVDGTGRIITATVMTGGGGYTNGETLLVLSPTGGDDAEFEATTGEANPLGWYTYKVVVKQQEQEYYNVYLPGFVNGLPIQNRVWDGIIGVSAGTLPIETQRGKIAFSTVLGDNINKIPRNLKEVGPTDKEYNSDEIFFIRINNPNTTDTLEVRNLQYYPINLSQNVLNLSTVKETELAAVPFQPFNTGPAATGSATVQTGGFTSGNQGDYGSTIQYIPSGTTAIYREPTGRIPWGDVADEQSFYAADQNPFIMKFSTIGTYNNPIGAIVCGADIGGAVHDSNYASGIRSMQPTLSVVETQPIVSLLDIFWETTLSGRLEELNSAIQTNYDGVVGTNVDSGTFAESVSNSQAIGPDIKFINGSGAEIENVVSVAITKVVKQNNPSVPLTIADYFTIAVLGTTPNGTGAKISTADYFWYGVSSNNTPSADTYIFDLQVTSDGGAYIDDLPGCMTLTLTNIAPAIYSDSGYTTNRTGTSWTAPNVAVGESTILQLYGLNGSVDTTVEDGTQNRTKELIWDITGVIPGSAASNFDISSTGLITANTTLINEQSYSITVSLTDVNNTGSNKETVTAAFTFTAGTANAPKIIGTGLTGTTGEKNMTGVGNKAEYLFANDSTYTVLTANATGNPFNLTPTFVYNAQRRYNDDIHSTPACTPVDGGATCCRANLFEGTIELKPKLFTGGSTFVGDATITFSIQYRASSSNSWANIDSVNAGAGYATWAATQTQQAMTMSTAVANQEVYYKYKFDQLGEYRVVTNALGGDGAAYVSFTVEFKDGAYNTAAGLCNPPA